MALATDIPIRRYGVPDGRPRETLPLAGSTTVYAGSICLTRAGYVINSDSPQSTDIGWGLVFERKPYGAFYSASTVSGTYTVDVECGSFYLASSTGSDTISAANVGATVYVYDAQTVALTNGSNTRPVAGVVERYETATVQQQPFAVVVKMGPNQSVGA
jgi:hypothetical protein